MSFHFLSFYLSFQTISERAFDGLNNLKRLDLGNNRLKTLERGLFATVPTLTYLNLMRNALETLTMLTVQPLMNNLVNHTSMLLIKGNLDISRFSLSSFDLQVNAREGECLFFPHFSDVSCVAFHFSISLSFFSDPHKANTHGIPLKNRSARVRIWIISQKRRHENFKLHNHKFEWMKLTHDPGKWFCSFSLYR